MLHLIQCFQVLIRAHCFVHNLKPHIWDLLHLFLSVHGHRGVLFPLTAPALLRGFGGNIHFSHSWRWQRGRVLGCSEGSESGAVKCSALAASLTAPYTASDPLFFFFFLLTPLPHANWCFLVEGVGFSGWGGENILFSLSWLAYLYREKVNLAQAMKEKSL